MTDRIATGNIYPKTQSPNGKLPNIKNGYSKKTTTLLYSASVTCLLINLKSASNLNGNLYCSKELEHYAS